MWHAASRRPRGVLWGRLTSQLGPGHAAPSTSISQTRIRTHGQILSNDITRQSLRGLSTFFHTSTSTRTQSNGLQYQYQTQYPKAPYPFKSTRISAPIRILSRALCQCRNRDKDSFEITPSAPNVLVDKMAAVDYRLPKDVKPTHYDLTLRTDLKKETFEGVVDVHLDVLKPTSSITLNSHASLSLSSPSLTLLSSSQSLVPNKQTYDPVQERATFAFEETLKEGSKAVFRVAFSGVLDGSMAGYYKSTWDKGIYTLTQFEPTSARKSLPCWDEPALKATFSVTMISRSDTVSLSNMPVLSSAATKEAERAPKDDVERKLFEGVESGEWGVTRFEKTPPMSTYLLAYANGPFEYIEASYTSPLSGKVRPLRIYTTPDKIHQAEFALEVKRKVLPIYEQVFDVEYPLPKLDTLVANDFDAGAMENWGLITGRTSAFLLDPKRADMMAKKRVATVQSHEVAHMWFGDITTMEWWNYLYLNEGFATMMGEVIIIDKVFPEWKVDSEFITEHLNDALRLDAKLSSHPIEVDCPDANQINQIFDSLSYAKAASVLRMLSFHVGIPAFLKGVSIYLKNHLYANSTTSDLWAGISKATGEDVEAIMTNWVTQMGFPVLSVTELEGGKKIRVRQDRFLEDGPAKEEDNKTIWTVPLSLLTTNAKGESVIDRKVVLDKREAEFEVDTTRPWKLNADTCGVFRVLYTPARLASIAQEAAKPTNSAFSLNDRIGLVHDAMALAKSGHLKVSAALEMVDILRNEEEFLVWDSISENVARVVDTWWENETVVDQLNAFRRELYVPLVKKLGYEYSDEDSADRSQLRTRAIEQAVLAKDETVIKELRDRFASFAKTGDDHAIPADLLRITFRTAVEYGGKEEYEVVAKLYESAKTPTIQQAAIRAMGSTQDKALIERTFAFLMDKARDQDVIYFFFGAAPNKKFRRELMAFFERNFDAIYKRFEGNFMMRYFVTAVYSGFSTVQDAQHTEEFFKGKDQTKYNQALAQALDTVKSKAVWIERSTDDIVQWLEKRKSGTKL